MKRLGRGLAFAAVAAAPWLMGLQFPFLYDDIGMIAENDYLADSANWTQVVSGRTLSDPAVVNGRRPAVLATYFADRALYGLRPAGWRVTSLLLHLGCAGLWVGLLRRLGADDWLALAAGLLFALHPAGVEAVHAPGFRADVLCLLLMLAGLHAFAWARERFVLGLAGGLALGALALLAKETALVLPLLLAVLMGFWPEAFPRERGRRFALVAACGALALGFFALWLVLPTELQAVGGAWNGESLRFPETIWSAPALGARSAGRLLWPWPLNVTPRFAPVVSAGSWRFWAALLFGMGWVGAAWGGRRARPWLALGLAWVVIFFLPVANVLPLLHPVADRYLYPQAAGMALAVAWGVSRLPRPGRGWALAGLAAVCAALLLAGKAEWSGGERLWTKAWQRNPQSATAAVWLGLASEEADDAAAARQWYARAVEANPHQVSGRINWGILEGKAGAWEASERLLREAMEIAPENTKARHNLAVCLEQQGRFEEARGIWNR